MIACHQIPGPSVARLGAKARFAQSWKDRVTPTRHRSDLIAKSILRFFKIDIEFDEIGSLLGDAFENGSLGGGTKHKVVLEGEDGGRIVFKGKFKVDNGVVTGGKVTGYTALLNGDKVIEASGYDVSFADLKSALDAAHGQNDQSEQVFRLMLTSDLALGSNADDKMFGISKLIKGGKGDDTIFSTFRDKTIEGEAGNDLIVAGLGNDKLFGGKGRDTFAFTDVNRRRGPRPRFFGVVRTSSASTTAGSSAMGGLVEATEFVVGEEALTGRSSTLSTTISRASSIGTRMVSAARARSCLRGSRGGCGALGGELHRRRLHLSELGDTAELDAGRPGS